MKTACDMFGPDDVSTLGEVVEHVEEYDEEGWLYVMPDRPLRSESLALVVDEGCARHWSLVEELGLVEHHEMFVVREVIECQRNQNDPDDDAPSTRAIVRVLDQM